LRDFSVGRFPPREALVKHLKDHALQTGGSFRLRSGTTTSWYLDARRTTFDGFGAVLVGRCLLEVLDPAVRALGGMTMGADPMALAAALLGSLEGRELRAFSIRKEEKNHGTGGRLVGPVEAGDPVAVLEDTTTTGGALLEAIRVAREAGLHVRQAVALVDRSGGEVKELLALQETPYLALLTPGELGVLQ
jgi:orotate phosphoribosyltransferase